MKSLIAVGSFLNILVFVYIQDKMALLKSEMHQHGILQLLLALLKLEYGNITA